MVMTQIFPIRSGWDGYDKKILQQQLKASNKNSLYLRKLSASVWPRVATFTDEAFIRNIVGQSLQEEKTRTSCQRVVTRPWKGRWQDPQIRVEQASEQPGLSIILRLWSAVRVRIRRAQKV